jgi:integrase
MSVLVAEINTEYLELPISGVGDSIGILKLSPKNLYELNPVVTYDELGEPLNYFRDNQWNYKAYSNQNTNRVEAKYIVSYKTLNISNELLSELKASILHVVAKDYPKSNNARVGQALFEQTSKFFIDLNDRNQKSIANLQHPISLLETLTRIGGRYALNTLQASLFGLNKITKLKITAMDFILPVDNGRVLGSDADNTLNGLAKKYCRAGTKVPEQTLYIPSNIHSKMMNSAFDMLSEGEDIINRINDFFIEHWQIHKLSENLAASEPENATRSEVQRKRRSNSIRRTPSKSYKNKGIITRQELLEKHKLKHIDDAYAATGKGIFYYTGIIAASCYVIIASFSGMREDEVMALKDNSFKTKGAKKRKIHFLRSYESKISGGQHVDYVTSPLTERAINLLKKLHSPAKELIPELKDTPFLCITHPLLRLPTYGVSSLVELLPRFMSHFNIKVSADDLEQHYMFNSNSLKEVNIGDVWPIASHQFRRTLIVNFLTHGIVGITQIKQQVKHMYSVMTQYYGHNADLAMALNLTRSDDFKNLLDEEQLNVGLLLYKRFYQSEEHLEGEKGKEIEIQRGLAQQLTDDEIKLLIRTGAFKITSTPFGFCTKGDLCDKGHIVDPTFCGAKCETMIITMANALVWKRLYNRNILLLKSEAIEGFGGTHSMMKAQNAVAIKIMNSFDITY